MKRRGPPLGGGPRSGTESRVAEQRSPIRSDNRHASPASHSPAPLPTPTASADHLAGTALNVVLTARGRSRFDASLNETQSLKRAYSQSVPPPASFMNSAIQMTFESLFGIEAPIIMRSAADWASGGNGAFAKTAACHDTSLGSRFRAWWGPETAVASSRLSNIGLRRKTHPRRRPAQAKGIRRTLGRWHRHRPCPPVDAGEQHDKYRC
jgi:hypothetical protein